MTSHAGAPTGPLPDMAGRVPPRNTRAASPLQSVCSTADKALPRWWDTTQDSGIVPHLAGSDPYEGAQYAASSARLGGSLWSWLTISAPARRMFGIGIDYVWACPSAGELWNLTYHDRAIHTGRQRAQAHYGRATGSYTRSVERSPPHLGATRGHALCQAPFMHANARVCRSPH